MQKDSAQAKISLKVVGGLLFLTRPVYSILYSYIHTPTSFTFKSDLIIILGWVSTAEGITLLNLNGQ